MTLIRTVYRGFMVGCMVSYRPTDSSQSVTLQVKSTILENLLQHQENKRPEKRGIRSNLNNHKELNRFNV